MKKDHNPQATGQVIYDLQRPLFPLVRHLSAQLTPLLINAEIRANQISFTSMLVGLAAAVLFLQGTQACDGLAIVVFILYAVLDSCDGEVARLTGTQSDYGAHLDHAIDWLVHSALFLALGASASSAYGDALWLWCAYLAVFGLAFDYVVRLWLKRKMPSPNRSRPRDAADTVRPEDLPEPPTWKDRLVFVLRHLLEKDFCFVLALFVLFDATWILLAGAAVGMQAYWLAGLYRRGRAFHV